MKDKKYRKVRYHCHYTGKYGGVAHTICNLKYKVPKKVPIAFHNGSNYDYLVMKELAEEFKKQFLYLGGNTETYMTFTVSTEKEVTKIYLAYNNLLIAPDLLQAHYQILPIIFLTEFIKLHANKGTMVKKCVACGITYEVCDCFLE